MINFEEILNKKATGVLATISEDGPQTRVFQCLWVEKNKAYFSTGSQKDVYTQLANNPKASFCVENKFSPVISISGNVHFVEEIEYKERAFQILPAVVKNLYQAPTHPNFKVFYIDIKQIKTFSYAEGLNKYTL